MILRVIVGGSGGQGVMLLGKVLAEAAMREGKFVTWLPSYGPEVRGGTSHCMVVISDTEIGSAFIKKADCLIIMNAPSLTRFKGRLASRGKMIINNSLVTSYRGSDSNILSAPFSDMAIKLGNIRVANMIALGSLITFTGAVKLETVSGVIADMGKAKPDLIRINQDALRQGAALK